jgi:hypothetical protein
MNGTEEISIPNLNSQTKGEKEEKEKSIRTGFLFFLNSAFCRLFEIWDLGFGI